MIRVTTNATLKSYRYNLMQSSNNRNDAQNTVLTGRYFNSFSEDPATATRCFQLRRNYQRVESQHGVGESVVSKYEVAWSSILSVVDDVNNMKGDSSLTSIVEAGSDTAGAGRNALGQQLEQLAEGIVSTMNAKFGDNFVFAGADGLNVPFTWDEDGNLCYRGINVNAEVGTEEYETLQYLVKEEKKFADIGLGMEEDANGNLIETSAYNVALHGINFLGYGTNEDGSYNNIVTIIKEMGDILQNCDENGYFQDGDRARFDELFAQFEDSAHALEQKHIEMDTEAEFLKDNQLQLEKQAYTLKEQYILMEDVDQADAITAYSWAQYSYNAALRVGNSILSESLMDYINP